MRSGNSGNLRNFQRTHVGIPIYDVSKFSNLVGNSYVQEFLTRDLHVNLVITKFTYMWTIRGRPGKN